MITSPFGSTDVIDKATSGMNFGCLSPGKAVVTCTLGRKYLLYPAILISPSSSKGWDAPIEHRQPSTSDLYDPVELSQRIQQMGKWFHNLNLHGIYTAPDHFLGDFPNIKWQKICNQIPSSLEGKSVLDIGCNGGFYSIEMKRRGADYVLGVDVDERYLNQARFAAQTLGCDIDFRKCSVYELDSIPGQFDYVIFMGVFYHLRYPLLGLDLAVKKAAGTFIFQSMLRGSNESRTWASDYSFWQDKMFLTHPSPPCISSRRNTVPTPPTGGSPNRSAAEAMLRAQGSKLFLIPSTRRGSASLNQLIATDVM